VSYFIIAITLGFPGDQNEVFGVFGW
jgi:hypothetical protein